MIAGKIIAGIVLAGIGLVFIFNNKEMAKGAFKFYRWFYTEERLIVMFKVAGVMLIVGGIVLVFVNSSN